MPSIPPSELEKRIGTIKGTLPRVGKANTLSIAMIVKNEEKNIEAAIRSFLPFADEIVVNDTGSTDRTLEILSRLPVRVIQNPWEGDFSKARNQSIAACTCSWVLWMDADDRVPAESIEDFKKLKTAPLDRSFGFQVINTQSGVALGARFYQTRMFPNHPKIRFERRVHEQLIYSIAALGLHTIFVETQILHTGYEDEQLKKAKSRRNLELMLGDEDYLIDPILPMQVGDAYSILEEWENAIQAYETSYNIPNCRQIQADAWAEIPNSIGRAYQSLGKYDLAEQWFLRGLEADSHKVEPVYFLGELYMKQGREDEALAKMRQAVQMERSHSSVANQYDVLKIHAYHHLCRILSSRGLFEEVIAIAPKFYQEYPQVIDAPLHQAKALLSLRRYTECEKVIRDVIRQSPKTKEAWDILFFALEGRQCSQSEIEAARQQAVQYHPEMARTSRASSNLSIAMIVKNEEANLANCLSSIAGLWDELIVVDTGSSDRTVQIAESFGARVLHFNWIGDFSAARNFSIDACQSRWILWLDADDVLPAVELARIKSLTQAPADRAYGFLIQNTTDMGVTGQCFSQIRLFPNHPKIRFEGRVHEQVLEKIKSAGVPVEFKTIKVFHTGYIDGDAIVAKQQRNLEIMLAEGGDHPENLTAVKQYSIAGAYQDLGQYELAIDWYHRSEARARRIGEDPHVREYAPAKVIQCLAELGRLNDAEEALKIYLGIYPFNPEGRLLDAQVYERQENHPAAVDAYARLFAFEEIPTLMPVDFNSLKYKAVRYISEMLHRSGFAESAIDLLRLGKGLSEGKAVAADQVVAILFDVEWYEACFALLSFEARLKSSADNDLQRARVLVMLNRANEALNLLKASLLQYPRHAELQSLHDLLHHEIGG